jgi:hypothetical protein
MINFLTNLPLQIGAGAENISNANVTIAQLPVITLANLFGDVTSTLIVLTLMIAITIRTSSEYIEAWIKGEAKSFNRKYLVTAGIAFVSSLPFAMILLPEASKLFAANFGQWGIVGSLLIVGVLGYGLNHGVNKTASLVGHFFSPSAASVQNKLKDFGKSDDTNPTTTTIVKPKDEDSTTVI